MNNNSNYKKSDEIISPIFGHDYKDRVVPAKAKENSNCKDIEATNYLEKQIEEKLDAQTKIEKVKEYQESFKTDTDVLRQYHKQKEDEELKAALPSNYLNFRDNLEKTSDLSTISDFTTIVSVGETIDDQDTITSTIPAMVDDIFDKVENN